MNIFLPACFELYVYCVHHHTRLAIFCWVMYITIQRSMPPYMYYINLSIVNLFKILTLQGFVKMDI
jgi:hypothetical protein